MKLKIEKKNYKLKKKKEKILIIFQKTSCISFLELK
jgi:hypothetical protein